MSKVFSATSRSFSVIPSFKVPFFLDWKSIMRLGAIDCAQDENVATCRNYEIMGYPSLKFFPPMASGKDLGELRESMGKDIGLMMADMTKYIDKLSANASFSAFWKKSAWPDFSVM